MLCGLVFVSTSAVLGQWDPMNGDWSKTDSTDLRVMTWNIEDGICSSANKVEAAGSWAALAHIVAGMKPDVLILQETADNSGNGTGSGVDSVSTLTTVLNLFLHGGNDPFKPGNPPVTSYVQLYAPTYDLPFIFVSAENDGFNRNVILSRFPFLDLNGDASSTRSDVPTVSADAYAPGGDGGIRGFMFVEIDLPNATYAGNLVMGNAHLKSGGDASDLADRLLASKNVAYVLDYWYNGAGFGVPDPNTKISDSPQATMILPANTPWVIGGDWNEDELTNGRKGPAEWLTRANLTGGTDGTDRDRTDAVYDAATDVFNGSRATRGSSKLDYLAWQDSIATLRRAFIFNANTPPLSDLPPEVASYANPSAASIDAADHRPVIADLILPLAGAFGACCTDETCADGVSQSTCETGGGEYNGDGSNCSTVACAPPPDVRINEIRTDQAGGDSDEYFELTGAPGTSLDGVTYLVIGDPVSGINSGVIETIINLNGETIPADGFFLAAESSLTIGGGQAEVDLNLGASGLNFEGDDNTTHMIVQGFVGSSGQDLDSNDDGEFDVAPWMNVIDLVAIIKMENPPTLGQEYHYGPPTVGPEGATSPGHVIRCPDSTGNWIIGILDPVGTDDTPGEANDCSSLVPTVSQWGMIVILLSVLVAGTVISRSRRSVSA